MISLLLYLNLLVHPFHVGVYDIEYEDEKGAVQITCRIFLDDLESALRVENGNEKLNIVEDSLLTHTTNQLYFQKNFKLSINGKSHAYNYLGGEIDNDVIWIYLEVEKVKQLNTIQVTNTILMDIYDDQKNITHFKINGEKESYILDLRDRSATYQ